MCSHQEKHSEVILAVMGGPQAVLPIIGEDSSRIDEMYSGWTILHVAVRLQNNEVVQFLCNRGADVNIVSPTLFNTTPLHMAVLLGLQDIVKILLERDGVDLNKIDGLGRTCLHIASEKGHEGIANLLIQRGAQVSPVRDRAIQCCTVLLEVERRIS